MYNFDVWRDINGSPHSITEMSDDHLRNCIRVLSRRIDEMRSIGRPPSMSIIVRRDVLQAELDNRQPFDNDEILKALDRYSIEEGI